jgi:GntR family transcriptional regulator
MTLWIQITPGSKAPLNSKVVRQISEAIAKGRLCAGDKLPPVRKLAAELVINPNTVARAYSQLEQAGLVTTKTGAGTFVTDPKLRDKDTAQLSILADRMDNLISQSLNLGLSQDETVEMFKRRFTKFTQAKRKDGAKKNE